MSRLSPLTHKFLMFILIFYSLRHIYFNMEQADDINYKIAETTVGKFHFYEAALCENFLNIVSRWGRVDEESKYQDESRAGKFLGGILIIQ